MKTIKALTQAYFVAVLTISAVSLAVPFTGVYEQNFDGMGQSGTTAPTDWLVYSMSGSHDTFTASNPPAATNPFGTLTQQNTLTAVTNPTNQRGSGGYNLGVSSSPTDRALGTSPSNIAGTILQLTLTNNSGMAHNSIVISYDIRRFIVTTNNNTSYDNTPYKGIEELPGYRVYYSLDNGSNWYNIAQLNPMDLVNGGSSGIWVPNSVGVTTVAPTLVSLNSSWNIGANLMLRWFDDNAQSPSPDQIIGLDNVRIVPEPATLAILGAGLLLSRAVRSGRSR